MATSPLGRKFTLVLPLSLKGLCLMTLLAICGSKECFAQNKKNGSPDMRYKANRGSNVEPNSSSNHLNYNSSGKYRFQRSYKRANGSTVSPHFKSKYGSKKRR